jgi:ferredoxin/flavodoxin---NADP+ reductase
MCADLNLPSIDPSADRAMVCGNPSMLADCCALLEGKGLRISPCQGEAGDYVTEHAIVEKSLSYVAG